MRSPEGYDKADIKNYLDSIGVWHFSPYMAGFGKAGVPDIICCIDGVFCAIEVKREGKEPTPIQQRRIEELEAAGGIAFWGTAKKVIGDMKIAFDD